MRPPCGSSHESHRPALELHPATVRGAPGVRSSVHPAPTLECGQRRDPVLAPSNGILRHHPGGARHAAPARLFDVPGAAHTTRPARLHAAQPDRRLRSLGGRRLSDAAFGRRLDGRQAAELGCSVPACRSSCRPPWARLGVSRCPDRPRTRVGWPLIVEPGAPGHLADPYGPTAELGGLYSL